MMKRRLEQIDQLQSAARQTIQLAEKYAGWNDHEAAKRLRDIAIATNRFRYLLIQREDNARQSREQRAVDALVRASRAGKVEDAVFEDVA